MINEMIEEEERQIDVLQKHLETLDAELEYHYIGIVRTEIGLLTSNLSKLKAIRDEVKRITHLWSIPENFDYNANELFRDLRILLGERND